MSRHYKRIYCCGDCVNYDWKKHRCLRGAKDKGEAQDHFYRDCPLKDYVEGEEQEGDSK